MASMDETSTDRTVTDNYFGTLGNFEIEKKIGRGQFSVVYKARSVLDNSITVALKKVQVLMLQYLR